MGLENDQPVTDHYLMKVERPVVATIQVHVNTMWGLINGGAYTDGCQYNYYVLYMYYM